MTIAVIQRFGPGEPDVYDRISHELDPDSDFDGLLFHWAGHVDGDWTVTDVWESEEKYQRFRSDRLMPALQKVTDGELGDPPRVQQVPVHAYIRP